MNAAAGWDALLVLCAFALAWQAGRRAPAIRLGGALLAFAAALGSLRFSGLLPLPTLHQLASALGAAVALPLLATTVVWPAGVVATQRRYAWITAVVAASVCVLVVVVAGWRPWSSAWALGSVLVMLGASTRRRQWWGLVSALCLLAGFAAFLGQVRWLGLQPGDYLHIGMAAGLVVYGVWWKGGGRVGSSYRQN